MYAILQAGGKQYKLQKNDEFVVNRIPGKQNSVVKFKNILFAKERNTYHTGSPYIKDAYVTCEILSHPRGRKVVGLKYKRRKNSKRKVGHRQDLTLLRVKEIKV